MAGLTSRFKRKKSEPADETAAAPAEAEVGDEAPAETPQETTTETPPEAPAEVPDEAPAESPEGASEEGAPPLEDAPAGEALPLAEPTATELPPSVEMPESKPGALAGLRNRFRRKKEPLEPLPTTGVPEGAAAEGAPVADDVAAAAAGALAGAAVGGVAETAEQPSEGAPTVEPGAEPGAEPVAEPGIEAAEGVTDADATQVLPPLPVGAVAPVDGQPQPALAPGTEAAALPPVEPVFMAPAPPPPATLIAGSALVAVVSRGPDPMTPPLSMIPNVTGLHQEEALDGLQELGIAAQIVLAFSAEVKPGRIIAQYPTPGTPFPETQTAVLVVSRGQAAVPHVVLLPNLVGMTEDEASVTIKQLGLEPFTVDAHDLEIPAGTVISQVPSPDSLAVAPVQQRRLWPWLLGAAALVLLLFGGFLLWRLNATYPVPSVIGQTQMTAQQTIEDAGFVVGSVISSPVAGVPRGAVASQIPSANAQAKLRSDVALVVSSGEPLVVIPNVVGRTESQATTDLAQVDLTTQAVRAYDATVPAGSVISQFPIAGDQVLPNTVIGLVVSRGRPPSIGATVPNVTGMTQAKATSAVTNAKLTTQVFTVPSATVASGRVVGQLPPPGSLVAKSSQVSLFVSRGRVSSTATLTASVPNLIGQTQIQAITNINSAGLIAVVAQAYSSAIPPGIVYAQVPQPGAIVSRETQVGIIVSQGPAPIQ